jgi:hypothetical protein
VASAAQKASTQASQQRECRDPGTLVEGFRRVMIEPGFRGQLRIHHAGGVVGNIGNNGCDIKSVLMHRGGSPASSYLPPDDSACDPLPRSPYSFLPSKQEKVHLYPREPD